MHYDLANNMDLRSVWGGGTTLLRDGNGNRIAGNNEAMPQINSIVVDTFVFAALRADLL
jgi:hypothetical protein